MDQLRLGVPAVLADLYLSTGSRQVHHQRPHAAGDLEVQAAELALKVKAVTGQELPQLLAILVRGVLYLPEHLRPDAYLAAVRTTEQVLEPDGVREVVTNPAEDALVVWLPSDLDVRLQRVL
ncbi:MAG: hypothetical protein JRE18_07305, partial [Deltaproteobacteria bacterium]|nr:hypothetical protein [Deltaproteobacteria bacterium]